MNLTVTPSPITGELCAPSSKSEAHRLLICSAFAPGPTKIECTTSSEDIDATVRCLDALGARVVRTDSGFDVTPYEADRRPEAPLLDCGESGSTLRFLLPVAAALGGPCSLTGHGRLPQRPLSPLYEELVSHGAHLSAQGSFPLTLEGKIRPGRYLLPGNVSSQYVSGLLMAAPLMGGPSEVQVIEPIESRPYIDMTIRALSAFGVEVVEERISCNDGAFVRAFVVSGSAGYATPGRVRVGGDWSNAAFWLAAGALGSEGVAVRGLDTSSAQGDRTVLAALALLGAQVQRSPQGAAVRTGALHATTLDVRSCPDLVPPLAAVAAVAAGTTRITGAARLRLKESDRLQSVSAAINALGGRVRTTDDGLVVEGVSELAGGVVDAANDHRIAMMAAVLAARCTGPVTIRGAECVNKSYPAFFEDLALLGGRVAKEA